MNAPRGVSRRQPLRAGYAWPGRPARRPALCSWLLGLAAACGPAAVVAQPRPIPPAELRSGLAFASRELRALQADDFQNPGMLWVDRGIRQWSERPSGGQPSCQDCHGPVAAMKGVATRHPKVDPSGSRLLDLTGSVNACRTGRQHLPALAHESDDMLGLTALIAQQSRGLPMAVSIDGPAARWFQAGRRFYTTRQGQMDLACTDCHDRHWGRHLLTETISQGQSNAYPIYRLEWQAMGSLHRRFRSCLSGVRAQLLPQGDDDFLALELYLAWRGQGLPIETPGVRR